MVSGVGGSIAIILLVFSILVFSILWITIILVKAIIRGIRGQARHSKTADQPERQTFPPTNQTPADPAQYDYDLVPFESDDGQGHGYVVQRLEDDQRLAWGSLTNRRECLESIDVAGESHHFKDLQADSFRPPARLMLVPEPENQYDPHAVAVWDADGRHQAGYIPGDEAQRIGKQLMEGHVVECVSMWETIVDGQRVSLRLLLLYQNARLRMPTEAQPQSVDQTRVCSRCQAVLSIQDRYCLAMCEAEIVTVVTIGPSPTTNSAVGTFATRSAVSLCFLDKPAASAVLVRDVSVPSRIRFACGWLNLY